MIVQTIPIPGAFRLKAEPLSREAFASFGSVLANPSPQSRPSNISPRSIAAGALPCGAVSANQGTAIQYRQLGGVHNLYQTASPPPGLSPSSPSSTSATPRSTMFICSTRPLAGPNKDSVEIRVLERHPFTTQTFVPLGASRTSRYLVVVAPSLAPSSLDEGLPVPTAAASNGAAAPVLPGRGLPDLNRLRAFVAKGSQAVTYGAGTWHAPMIALGHVPEEEGDSTIEFVVFQFANDMAVEDCQEVVLEGGSQGSEGDRRIWVRVPEQSSTAKL